MCEVKLNVSVLEPVVYAMLPTDNTWVRSFGRFVTGKGEAAFIRKKPNQAPFRPVQPHIIYPGIELGLCVVKPPELWHGLLKHKFIEALLFLPLGVASCCASIQLVSYDAVNRNKVSIRLLVFIFFFLTTCFGPYGPSSGEIYNCTSNIDNTPVTKKRQAITGEK
jgi:hypothetical protein